MGSETFNDKRAKREYSLAYNRTCAALKIRHEDEFRQLMTAFLSNIRMERELTGDIEREKPAIKHASGDDGTCMECGATSPCRAERDRERHARSRARKREAAAA